MNCPNPNCKRKIDRLRITKLTFQYMKLLNDELVRATGDFEKQKEERNELPVIKFFCPYCIQPLNIKDEKEAIQILKEDP